MPQDPSAAPFSVLILGCFTQAAAPVSYVNHDYSPLIDTCLLLIMSQLPTCMVFSFLLMLLLQDEKFLYSTVLKLNKKANYLNFSAVVQHWNHFQGSLWIKTISCLWFGCCFEPEQYKKIFWTYFTFVLICQN